VAGILEIRLAVPYVVSLWYDTFNPITGRNEHDPSVDEAMDILNSLVKD
jgi:hypothetical protein